jgi:hypothetical protein
MLLKNPRISDFGGWFYILVTSFFINMQKVLMLLKNLCKLKKTMIPKVILEDLQTQLYRDHMKMHVLICKFMGLWPTERTLHNWIKYHWNPSGEMELHLGLKGFFKTIFMNLEDMDRVFEGGPYFHASVGLYMWPWKENFSPEKRDFQKGANLAEILFLTIRLLVSLYIRRNRKENGKIHEDLRSHPKREIHILRKNLHRDGCVGSTPRSHKSGIQG